MGSIYQCPGCGEIGDGADANSLPCACERDAGDDDRVSVRLTFGQRATAILALTKAHGGSVDISDDKIIETILALLGEAEAGR